MQVEASRGPIEELDVQALAVAVFKNEKADDGFLKKLDELSGGLVRSALDAEEFSGKEGETAYFHLVGNNKLEGASPASGRCRRSERLQECTGFADGGNRGSFVAQQEREDDRRGAACFRRCVAKQQRRPSKAHYIALFDPDKYRTVEKEEKTVDRLVVVIEGADEDALQRGVNAGRIVGESVNFTRDLANEPGAYMTPTDMAERAREIANEFGLSIDVLDEARMEQEGMGSLLSVARGSDQPAKLVRLRCSTVSGLA